MNAYAKFQLAKALIIGLLCLNGFAAQADTSIDRATALIVKTTNEICVTPPLVQTSHGVELSADASAKIGGVVGKVVDVGVSGAAKYASNESSGVLQKDLAAAIASSNECRSAVSKVLIDRLLLHPPAEPEANSLPRLAGLTYSAKLAESFDTSIVNCDGTRRVIETIVFDANSGDKLTGELIIQFIERFEYTGPAVLAERSQVEMEIAEQPIHDCLREHFGTGRIREAVYKYRAALEIASTTVGPAASETLLERDDGFPATLRDQASHHTTSVQFISGGRYFKLGNSQTPFQLGD